MTIEKYFTCDSFMGQAPDEKNGQIITSIHSPQKPLFSHSLHTFSHRYNLIGSPAQGITTTPPSADTSLITSEGNEVKYPCIVVEFPPDFKNSSNQKYIQAIKATLLEFDRSEEPIKIIKNDSVIVCSDLVQGDEYCDHFLCFVNQPYPDTKTLPIYNAKNPFIVACKDQELYYIDLDPEKSRLIIKFKLFY
jgi:hypothetical protein